MDNSFEKEKTGAGAQVISYTTDRFSTALLSVSIALRLDGNAGANALLSYVLGDTCEKYPDRTQFQRVLAENYGSILSTSVSKAGETQILKFTVSCIEDRFALGFDSIFRTSAEFLCDIIFRPNIKDGVFDNDALSTGKRLLSEKIESDKGDKMIYARNRGIEVLCEKEAFSIPACGHEGDTDEISGSKLVSVWENVIEHGSFTVSCVSSAGASDFAGMIGKELSAFARKDIYAPCNEVIRSASHVRTVTETMPLNQGKLVMGFRAGMCSKDDNYEAVRIMTDIFGGNVYSKLFKIVREKMSLCYYCSSRLIRQKGIILVQSGVDTENSKKAADAICAQLEDMKNGNVTDDEIKASKLAMTDALQSVCDMPETIDSWIFSQCCDEDFVTPHDDAVLFSSVTAQDVIKAAGAVTLDTVYELADSGKKAK